MEIPEEFTDNEGRGSGTMRAPDLKRPSSTLAPIVKIKDSQDKCTQDRQQQFNFL